MTSSHAFTPGTIVTVTEFAEALAACTGAADQTAVRIATSLAAEYDGEIPADVAEAELTEWIAEASNY